MSKDTKIQWTDYTWSPWLGCRKVSPGCENCYITETTPFRTRKIEHGSRRDRTSDSYWKQPLRWNRLVGAQITKAATTGGACRSPRVFPSLCDPFDMEVPKSWFNDFFRLILATGNLTWLLLTKRPENVEKRMQEFERLTDLKWDGMPDNVWLGASAEDQKRADERIPILLSIPAKVRFLSVEPMLEHVDLDLCENGADSPEEVPWPKPTERGCLIDWVIVGGESGAKARGCNVDWIRSVVQQCKGADVPCFVKQLGSDTRFNTTGLDATEQEYEILNSPMSLQHSKGGDPSEWPEDLRVREFPATKGLT